MECQKWQRKDETYLLSSLIDTPLNFIEALSSLKFDQASTSQNELVLSKFLWSVLTIWMKLLVRTKNQFAQNEICSQWAFLQRIVITTTHFGSY